MTRRWIQTAVSLWWGVSLATGCNSATPQDGPSGLAGYAGVTGGASSAVGGTTAAGTTGTSGGMAGTSGGTAGAANGGAASGGAGGGDPAPVRDGNIFSQIHGFEPRFLEPTGSGMANIRRDFGAAGDGQTDDTAAFKRAIEGDEPRTIFIPAGTYLIKQQLRYGEAAGKKKRVLIIGEGRAQTILRLADAAAGFGDVSKPRAFIHTRSSAQQAEQNMHHYIYHLTIEIGRDNPGAIGLNFHTNNTGAVKDVTIRARDPVGSPALVGIAFDDFWFGPGNGRYLEIDGFRTGVRIGSAQNHTTLEHIVVRNCDVGLENTGFAASVRDLRTFGCKTGVRAAGGLTALVGARLMNGKGGVAVQLGKSSAIVTDLQSGGYDQAIASDAGMVAGPQVSAWSSNPAQALWPGDEHMPLNLPVAESPERQYPATAADYAVVGPDGDISGPLQAAIDAGKRTILVKGGRIEKTVELRNEVERIMGMGVRVVDYKTGTAPVFRLGAGASDAVIIELLYENYGAMSGPTVEQAAPRTVVFRHGSGSYRTAPGGRGGRVFIESVVGFPFVFDNVSAWVRDLNTEMGGDARPNVVNTGGTVWILGHKTEDYATKVATHAGGRTELLGGTYRQNWDAADGVGALVEGNPLFVIEDARASLSYLTWSTHAGAPAYKYLVRERRGGEVRNLVNQANGGEGRGTQALFVGGAP